MKWKFLSFSLVFYYFHFFLVSTDWIWIGEDESPGTDMATLAGLFLHVVSLAGRWHARGARWFTGRHDHHEFSNKKKRRGEEAKKLALTGDVIPEMEIFHLLPLRLIHWALDTWNEFETKIWIFGAFSEDFPFLDEAQVPASPTGGTWMDEIEIIWKFEFLAPFSDESPHKSPRWDSVGLELILVLHLVTWCAVEEADEVESETRLPADVSLTRRQLQRRRPPQKRRPVSRRPFKGNGQISNCGSHFIRQSPWFDQMRRRWLVDIIWRPLLICGPDAMFGAPRSLLCCNFIPLLPEIMFFSIKF